MRSWFASGVLLAAAVAVAVVGLLDAVFIEEHDFAVLFAADGLLVTGVVVLWATGRRSVGVERDLARWLQARAELTGEHVDRIADRALDRYRRDLDGRPTGTHRSPGP
jgi:hypothetical protein